MKFYSNIIAIYMASDTQVEFIEQGRYANEPRRLHRTKTRCLDVAGAIILQGYGNKSGRKLWSCSRDIQSQVSRMLEALPYDFEFSRVEEHYEFEDYTYRQWKNCFKDFQKIWKARGSSQHDPKRLSVFKEYIYKSVKLLEDGSMGRVYDPASGDKHPTLFKVWGSAVV